MGNGAICPTRFSLFYRISPVEIKYEALWHSEEFSACCLYLKSRCYFANPKSPFSSPTSAPLCLSLLMCGHGLQTCVAQFRRQHWMLQKFRGVEMAILSAVFVLLFSFEARGQ